VNGRLVRTLVDDRKERGNHAVVWDGTTNNGSPTVGLAPKTKLPRSTNRPREFLFGSVETTTRLSSQTRPLSPLYTEFRTSPVKHAVDDRGIVEIDLVMSTSLKRSGLATSVIVVCVSIAFGLLAPSPAIAQLEGSIFLSALSTNWDCELMDATPGLHTVHVIHSLSPGAKGSRFRIAAGPGMTMTYVSEVHSFPMTVGNTQSGISICYGDCLAGDFVVASITYSGYGTSSHCSRIQVVGHPASGQVEAKRCDDVSVRMAVEDLAVSAFVGGCGCPSPRSIPGTPQYFDCVPVPVATRTWGAIKALYSN
jgi:hypothetical protein